LGYKERGDSIAQSNLRPFSSRQITSKFLELLGPARGSTSDVAACAGPETKTPAMRHAFATILTADDNSR